MNETRTRGHVYALTALVPLAWAVLLLLHPAPDANDIFGSLREEANAWLVVHLGSLLFIGLTGAVLYLLLRDLHGPVVTLASVAIGTFVLFYGAAVAIAGIATGTLVQYVSDPRPDAQAAAAGAVQTLWDDFVTGDLLFLVGSIAWVVAVIAAAAAYRQVGAPLIVSICWHFRRWPSSTPRQSARSACCSWRVPWCCSPAASVLWWPRRGIRQFRDAHRNGAGAVGVHPLLVNQITRRTR